MPPRATQQRELSATSSRTSKREDDDDEDDDDDDDDDHSDDDELALDEYAAPPSLVRSRSSAPLVRSAPGSAHHSPAATSSLPRKQLPTSSAERRLPVLGEDGADRPLWGTWAKSPIGSGVGEGSSPLPPINGERRGYLQRTGSDGDGGVVGSGRLDEYGYRRDPSSLPPVLPPLARDATGPAAGLKRKATSSPPPRHPVRFSPSQSMSPAPPNQSRVPPTTTATGKARKRVANACDLCRKKKIKCDGKQPCTYCTERGRDCQYAPDPRDKSTFSRQYVTNLEERLRALEDTLNSERREREERDAAAMAPPIHGHRSTSSGASMGAASPSAFTDRPPRLPVPRRMTYTGLYSPHGTKEGGGGSGGGDLTEGSSAGTLQLDENRSLRYLGPSASVTLFLDAHQALGAPTPSLPMVTSHPLTTSAEPPPFTDLLQYLQLESSLNLSPLLPSAESVTFPPYELANTLVRLFFEKIHAIYPVLKQEQFQKAYNELYAQRAAGGGGTESASQTQTQAPPDPSFLAILFAVFACASRLLRDPRVCPPVVGSKGGAGASSSKKSSQPRDDKEGGRAARKDAAAAAEPAPAVNYSLAGVQFFARAQVMSLHHATQTRVEQVQCKALLAFYMAQSNCAARAWILAGNALRIAIDLGMHRDLTHLQLDHEELELRRRVFWSVYIIDRILGTSLGRPLGIEDEDIDQILPTLEPQPPFPLIPGFVSMITLHGLTGRISRTVVRLEAARRLEATLSAAEEGGGYFAASSASASTTAAEAAAEAHALRAQTEDLVRELDEWHGALPSLITSETHDDASSPVAVQSCAVFACYQSTRMLLHRGILRDAAARNLATHGPESGESRTLHAAPLDACRRTALAVIGAAPRVASSLPASHFLLEYAQHLLVSSGLLCLIASKFLALPREADGGGGGGAPGSASPHDEIGGSIALSGDPLASARTLLEQAEGGVAGLRTLERGFPGARTLRKACARLVRALRVKMKEAIDGVNHPVEAAAEGPGTASAGHVADSVESGGRPSAQDRPHDPRYGASQDPPGGAEAAVPAPTGEQGATANHPGDGVSAPTPAILTDADLLAFTDGSTSSTSGLELWGGLDWLNGLLSMDVGAEGEATAVWSGFEEMAGSAGTSGPSTVAGVGVVESPRTYQFDTAGLWDAGGGAGMGVGANTNGGKV